MNLIIPKIETYMKIECSPFDLYTCSTVGKVPSILESQILTISMEADLAFPQFKAIRNFIPNFLAYLTGSTQNLSSAIDTNDNACVALSSQQMKSHRAIDKLNYAEFSQTIISVPENFEGNLYQYTQFLNKVHSEIFALTKQTVSEYIALLSMYISNNDALKNLQDHSLLYVLVQNKQEEITKQLFAYFPSITGKTKKLLADVCNSPSELKSIVTSYTQQQALNKSLKEFLSDTKKAANYLNMLYTHLKLVNDKDISSYTAKNLAKGAYQMAKLVELNSVLCFHNSVLINCIEKLLDQINKS